MTHLVCRAERLEEPVDLLSFYVPDEGFFFEHDDGGIVGWGAAERIPVPAGPEQVARAAERAARVLSEIAFDGEIAPAVVGALPFDGEAPATLVVPAVAVVRRPDGATYRVTVSEPDEPVPSIPSVEPCAPPRPKLRLTPVPTPAAYVDAVAGARKRILQGDLEKVVLARMLVARAEEPFDRRALLRRLRDRERSAYLFAAHGFVGASPDLLIVRSGNQVRAEAVGGTAAQGEGAAERLLGSAKDRAEHALIVDAVRPALEGVCASLQVDAEPQVVSLRTVLHLKTHLQGVLREAGTNALELAARLHPTPAVCGTPPSEAMRLIRELEGIDRTLYAGIVGWMDARGDGEWALALRCAEVQGRIALLFAGAGIVADSDPEAELAETDAKFESMLDALGVA